MFTACTVGPEPPEILIQLPTPTATSTHTPSAALIPTATITSTPASAVPPTVPGPPTVTPEPYLYIELTIRDAETGEAVAGEVHLGLWVDDNSLGYPLERNVSEATIELPRDIMRADAVYINVIADGYLSRFMRLPPEAKTAKSVTIELMLEKLTE